MPTFRAKKIVAQVIEVEAATWQEALEHIYEHHEIMPWETLGESLYPLVECTPTVIDGEQIAPHTAKGLLAGLWKPSRLHRESDGYVSLRWYDLRDMLRAAHLSGTDEAVEQLIEALQAEGCERRNSDVAVPPAIMPSSWGLLVQVRHNCDDPWCKFCSAGVPHPEGDLDEKKQGERPSFHLVN